MKTPHLLLDKWKDTAATLELSADAQQACGVHGHGWTLTWLPPAAAGAGAACRPLQRFVVQLGHGAEGVGPLQHPLPDPAGDFLGRQEQLVRVGIKGARQPAEQVAAEVRGEVQPAVLDAGQVGDADPDQARQGPLAQAIRPAQLSQPMPGSRHGRIPTCGRGSVPLV
jgi:hypothetical protein